MAKGENLKRERLTITLGAGQKPKIDAIAKKKRTNAATVIRWAIDQYLASSAGSKH